MNHPNYHLALAFILLLAISACTTTHIVKSDETLILDKSAIIVTIDQPPVEFKVYNIFAGRDSLVASDMFIQRVHKFHLSEIDQVIVKRRIKGAFQGAVAGLIAGSGFGYAISAGSGWEAFVMMVIGSGGALIGSIPGSIIAAKDVYYFELDSLSLRPRGSKKKLNPSPEKVERAKRDSLPKPRQLSLEEIARAQLPDKRPEPQNQIAGMFYTQSKSNIVNWVAGYAYRRYFPVESVLPPRYEQWGKYYLNLSYKYITGHVEEPSDYYITSKMFSGLLGLEAFRSGNIQSGAAGFFEIGLTAGSLERAYASNYDQHLGGGGITGVVGYRSWSNLLFAEGRLNYTTWFGHIIPSIAVGYRF